MKMNQKNAIYCHHCHSGVDVKSRNVNNFFSAFIQPVKLKYYEYIFKKGKTKLKMFQFVKRFFKTKKKEFFNGLERDEDEMRPDVSHI